MPFQQQQQHQTPFLLLDCGCCSGKLVTGSNRRFLLNEYPPDGSQVRLKLLVIFHFFGFGTLSSICITNWFQKTWSALSISVFLSLSLIFLLTLVLVILSYEAGLYKPTVLKVHLHIKELQHMQKWQLGWNIPLSLFAPCLWSKWILHKNYVVESSVEIRGKATFYNKNSLLSGGDEPKTSQSWVLCLNH